MSLKKFVTALTAMSLAAAPTVASAQVAAPAPAEETVEGSQLGESGVGQVLPVFVIIAIVLLIREIVKDRDLGEPPISP